MHKEISIEQQLFAMTTIIETEHNIKNSIFKAQASGFFFTETIPLSLPADNQDGHWEKLDKFWLITNRHVVINKADNTEYLAEKFTFNLRETLDNSIEWYPITLTKNELKSSLLVHSNKNVDVAVSKKYVLLGVYSGEYNWIDFVDTGYTKFQQKRSYELGNVWYRI